MSDVAAAASGAATLPPCKTRGPSWPGTRFVRRTEDTSDALLVDWVRTRRHLCAAEHALHFYVRTVCSYACNARVPIKCVPPCHHAPVRVHANALHTCVSSYLGPRVRILRRKRVLTPVRATFPHDTQRARPLHRPLLHGLLIVP